MCRIEYLLKFSKRTYIESFAKGDLYFSNAKKFWKIEDETKKRGQGDSLEGSFKIYAENLKITDSDNQSFTINIGNCTSILRHESASLMPMICLFAVFENDCKISENGEKKIMLTEKTINTIKTHFPNADSVAIISNPIQFIDDIKASIKCDIQSGLVNYFNIDEGYVLEDGKHAADLRLFKYLTQDTPTEINNRRGHYSFMSDYEYRVLFCKDVFFKEQQEYRVVLIDKKINDGTIFSVHFSQDIQVKNIDEFFNEMTLY